MAHSETKTGDNLMDLCGATIREFEDERKSIRTALGDYRFMMDAHCIRSFPFSTNTRIEQDHIDSIQRE